MNCEIYYASEKSPEAPNRANEDHCLFTEISFMKDCPVRLVVIADGMGGLFGGKQASKDALIGFTKSIYDDILQAYIDADMLNFSLKYTIQDIRLAMIRAIVKANNEICQNADPFMPTGSTISAVCLIADYAVIANIGDSPVYYYKKNKKQLSLVSKIQTKAELDVESGIYDRYSNEYYSNAHLLSASLGEYNLLPESMIHVLEIGGIEPGDMFIAGTDGAFGKLKENVIATLMEEYEEDGDFLLKQLFGFAGIEQKDDQTAILCVFTERGSADEKIIL